MPEISTALIIKIIVIAVAIGGGIAVIYSVKKAVSNAIGRQLSRANDLLRTINDATEERQAFLRIAVAFLPFHQTAYDNTPQAPV